MTKLSIFKLKDKYYEQHIWILVGDKELFKKYVRKKYDITTEFIDSKGLNGDGKTLTLQHGNDIHILIWIREFNWRVFEIGLLVHELFHVVSSVLKEIGFKFSEDSEEAYTYYLQVLTQESFWKLRKLRGKK